MFIFCRQYARRNQIPNDSSTFFETITKFKYLRTNCKLHVWRNYVVEADTMLELLANISFTSIFSFGALPEHLRHTELHLII